MKFYASAPMIKTAGFYYQGEKVSIWYDESEIRIGYGESIRKDDLVTFEKLGVDRIFIDESHPFKNLFLATKMRNVGGIAQAEAQKSSDFL